MTAKATLFQCASIRLHGQAFLFDSKSHLRRFLIDFHPILRTQINPSPLLDRPGFHDPSESELSKIELWPNSYLRSFNSWYHPFGFSRHGYFLVLVDLPGFVKLAQEAWGWAPEPQNTLTLIADAPDVWGITNSPILLDIDEAAGGECETGQSRQFQMYALPPIRITTESLELVALPLVDVRWFWQHTYATSQPSIERWSHFSKTCEFSYHCKKVWGRFHFPITSWNSRAQLCRTSRCKHRQCRSCVCSMQRPLR